MKKETTRETVREKSMADFKHPETIGLHGSDYEVIHNYSSSSSICKRHHTNLKMQKPTFIWQKSSVIFTQE